jgi:hypothetical protein
LDGKVEVKMDESGDPEGADFAAGFTKKVSRRSFQINLHRFFPPEDEFATCVARHCILREDLCLEFNGIVAGPYEWLDMNGTIWRRNYFFRTSIRTLLEITSAIHKLNSVPEFQNAVEKSWSEEDKGKYKEFCKDIETAKQLVKEMRNIIGGHVKHTVVARALQEPHICFDRFLGIPSRP